MKGQRFTPEKIIGPLRQAEEELAQGQRVGEVCRGPGISEQSFYRWRTEYGGLKLEQARRMKDLEKENGRLMVSISVVSLQWCDRPRNRRPRRGGATLAAGGYRTRQ